VAAAGIGVDLPEIASAACTVPHRRGFPTCQGDVIHDRRHLPDTCHGAGAGVDGNSRPALSSAQSVGDALSICRFSRVSRRIERKIDLR